MILCKEAIIRSLNVLTSKTSWKGARESLTVIWTEMSLQNASPSPCFPGHFVKLPSKC